MIGQINIKGVVMINEKHASELEGMPGDQLVEIPRFFERANLNSATEEDADGRGESEVPRPFQARWWPGDLKLFSPPNKPR